MFSEEVAEGATQEESPLDALDAKFEEVFGPDKEPSFSELIKGPEETSEEGTETVEEAPAEEVAGEVPVEEKVEESPAIDPSLVALAVQEGADSAKLDELIESDPAEANELLTKLADEVNSQTLRTLQGQPEPAPVEEPVTPEGEVSPIEALLTNEEAKAAAEEKYGEDLVSEFLIPLAKQAKQSREDHAYTQQLRENMEAAQQQAMIAELNATFKGFGSGYTEFYGQDFSGATDAQVANRQKVTQIADKLRSSDFAVGAPVKESAFYITQAHHVVAADERKTATRRELLSKIQSRSKSVTAKPSRGNTTRAADGSEEAAIQALGRKMAELGVEDYFRD